jgi:DNA-binding NtrC family response regulator/pSer/pThr/pTyr-binding forkhead associated (FHA) protein
MPALLLLTGPSAGRRYEVVSEVTIGRSPSCEIALHDDKASRRHAKLVLREGQVWISDLGSFNGTAVNGERIQGEVSLQPGDRVQVGQTVAVFEPPPPAALAEAPGAEPRHTPIEEVLPHVGAEGALYSAGTALLGATSEAMVLRRLVDECVHALNADRAAALLSAPEGLLTAAVFGASAIEVPRALAGAALEHRELGRTATAMSAPLVASGGQPFGLLYAERSEPPLSAGEGQLLAALGRLGGEACAAVRSRSQADAERLRLSLVGTSRPFRKGVELARRAAASAAPLVISGEPGTGKALFARYVHAQSPRALGPLVTVDCRQPLSSVEEELFGHPGGAGSPPMPSALMRADGGSLLLLHVEALPRPLAERLSRLLSRKVAPAPQGGEEPVEARLLVTTDAPVSLMAVRGEVEAALARALSGLEMQVPPLRERRADVPALFEHFAAQASRSTRKGPPLLTPEARRLVVDYAWPQNVRELRLVTERLTLLYSGEPVHALRLPPELQEGGVSSEPKSLQERVARLERDAISEALREAGGKKIRAAELLGISRPTLDKKIQDYALTVEKVRRS